MKKRNLILVILLFILFALLIAEPALAVSYSLKNPLHGLVGDKPLTVAVATLIGSIIQIVMGVLGAVALVLFVYGGFTLLSSAGSSDKISKGKTILIWSTIGLLLVIFSYTIIDFTILCNTVIFTVVVLEISLKLKAKR